MRLVHSVTVISMVRFSFIMHVNLKSPDITWNFSDSIIWTNAEGNIAVICCQSSSASFVVTSTH